MFCGNYVLCDLVTQISIFDVTHCNRYSHVACNVEYIFIKMTIKINAALETDKMIGNRDNKWSEG